MTAIAILVILTMMAACGGKPKTPGVANKEAGPVAGVEDLDTAYIKVVDGIIMPNSLPVVVDFNATWCPPCKKYGPIYEEVADSSMYTGKVVFLSIDVDKHPEIANRYEIMNIPCTVFILPGGAVFGKEVGLLSQEKLMDFVNQLIEQSAGEGNAI